MSEILGKVFAALQEVSVTRPMQSRYDEEGNLVCFYCGDPLSKKGFRNHSIKEHFLCRSLGGTSKNTNLVWACHTCNAKKGSMHFLKWLMEGPINVTDEIAYKLIALTIVGLATEVHQREDMPLLRRQLIDTANTILDVLGDEED